MDTNNKSAAQAAQAQASKPIAAVHGWFHGECVIRPLDPEAVLPAGMALYSQPQAQAGEVVAVGVIDYAFMAGVALTEEGASLPCGTKLYTAPPAAKVNQQLLEALKHIMKMQTFGYIVLGEEATTKARAAIAAAQDATPSAVPVNQQLPAARVWNQAEGRDGKLYAHGWNDCLAAIAAAQEQSK